MEKSFLKMTESVSCRVAIATAVLGRNLLLNGLLHLHRKTSGFDFLFVLVDHTYYIGCGVARGIWVFRSLAQN